MKRQSRNMKFAMVAFLLLTVGCYTVPAENGKTKTVMAHQLTDKEKFALLDKEVKKRNLRYMIFCVGPNWNDPHGPERYQANAEHREAKQGAHYADEGRMDEWMAGDNRTQADAALALYKLIQGAPSHLASKWFVRPAKENEEVRQCEQEIKGNY